MFGERHVTTICYHLVEQTGCVLTVTDTCRGKEDTLEHDLIATV